MCSAVLSTVHALIDAIFTSMVCSIGVQSHIATVNDLVPACPYLSQTVGLIPGSGTGTGLPQFPYGEAGDVAEGTSTCFSIPALSGVSWFSCSYRLLRAQYCWRKLGARVQLEWNFPHLFLLPFCPFLCLQQWLIIRVSILDDERLLRRGGTVVQQ